MTPSDMFVGRVKRLVAEGDDEGLRQFYAGICEGARGTEQPTLSGEVRERAAVVKYLRDRAKMTFGQAELWLLGEADAIEKGEHLDAR